MKNLPLNLSKIQNLILPGSGSYVDETPRGDIVSPRGKLFHDAIARNETLKANLEQQGDDVTISTSSSAGDSINESEFHELDKKLLELTKELGNIDDKNSAEAQKVAQQITEVTKMMYSLSTKVEMQHKELLKKQDKALVQNEEIKEGVKDIQEGVEEALAQNENIREGVEGLMGGVEDIQLNLSEVCPLLNAIVEKLGRMEMTHENAVKELHRIQGTQEKTVKEIRQIQGEQHRARSNQLANHFDTSKRLSQIAKDQSKMAEDQSKMAENLEAAQEALLKKLLELSGEEHTRTRDLMKALDNDQRVHWVEQEKDMNDLLAEFEKVIIASFKTALNEQDAKITLSINQKGEDLNDQLACAADLLKSCHKESSTLIRQLNNLQDARQSELMTKIEEVLTKKKKSFFSSKS